jgi:hypothetical protein
MKNYFYLLLLLCSIKILAQADCYLPRQDGYNFNLTSSTNSGAYFASNILTANNAITNARYLASNSVVLGDGFKATSSDVEGVVVSLQDCRTCSCVDVMTARRTIAKDSPYICFYAIYGNILDPCIEDYMLVDWYFRDKTVLEDTDGTLLLHYSEDDAIERVEIESWATGCKKIIYYDSSIVIDRPSTISSYYQRDSILVTPNPSATGVFDLNCCSTGVNIFNKYNLPVPFKQNGTQVDLSNNPDGIYFLRYITDYGLGNEYFAKLIKGRLIP